MVAHLLRLKLTLLRNSLRRSPWQLVGIILGALYGIGMLAALMAGLFYLGFTDPVLARTALVLGGSLTILGWALVPLVTSGMDMTLDPARFATFAVPLPKLLTGLAVGGLIGIPGAITLLAALASAASWWKYPVAAAAAVPSALAAVFVCLIAAHVTVAATTSLTGSRRFKDISGVVILIPLMLLGPIIAGIGQVVSNSSNALPAVADTLSWTPLGALWAVPGDIALGHPGTAAAKAAIGAAFLALLVLAWRWLLQRALVNPPHSGTARRKKGNLGVFARFPATPTGAVAARALIYWFRDPRYGASLVVLPVLVVLLVFATDSSEGALVLPLVLGPLVGFLLSYSLSADVSYDNTAFALHLATGVSGAADRAGRVLACAVFAVPLTLAAAIIPAALTGYAELIPAVLGLSLGMLLTGFGLSSVVSARYTYNVPLPGDSPFKTPPGSAARSFLVQGLGMLVQLLLAAPTLALAVAALVTGSTLLIWLTAVVGVVLGLVLLATGIRVGGRWMDRRGPELLQAVTVNK